MAINEKTCRGCNTLRPASDFGTNRARKDGLQARCRFCRKQYREQDHRRRISRDRLLKFNFGITIEQYEALLEKQQGLCAICGKPELSLSNARKPKLLSVDHDHETGAIRGLLCQRCNIGLGHLDTRELLKAASKYLERHNETAVALT